MIKKIKIRDITETVIFVSLSTVLYFTRIYTLPMGGSITVGSMIPIIWLSLRRGTKIGIGAGLIFGLIVMIIEPFLFHPFQIFLDYFLAFGLLGLAGLSKKRPLVGVTLSIIGRFTSHLFSGIIFADIYVPVGENSIIYSALYNGSYLIPELIISAIIISILLKKKILEYAL